MTDAFDRLASAFGGRPRVALPGDGGGRGFGADALRIDGSIFAMESHGRLIVKLPRARVAELIAQGAGEPFDAGKGRPLKEWLAVTATGDESWRELAEEALAFVGSRRG